MQAGCMCFRLRGCAIDEHIKGRAGEANDAQCEAVLILCAKCHFCRVPRRFKAAPAARSFQMFGFLARDARDWRIRLLRVKCLPRSGPCGADGGAGGGTAYWRDAAKANQTRPRDAAVQIARELARLNAAAHR